MGVRNERSISATAANTITNGFDATYAVPNPLPESRWADPTTPTTIKRTESSAASDTTALYYGAKVSYSTLAGGYVSTVQYTATMNTMEFPSPTIVSVSPASGSAAGGTSIQIVATGLTLDDTSITSAVTIGGRDCRNVSISSDTPVVGQDTVYCTTPLKSEGGAVDIIITTWGGAATKAGAFTYIIPTPTIATPTAGQIFSAATTSTTLKVETDIAAVCYYGTDPAPTTKMATTGAVVHTQLITSLQRASTNTRYVRCRAEDGINYSNYFVDKSVTFYVKGTTPLTPVVSPANGSTVPSGTTAITVVSSTVGSTCTWGPTSATRGDNASGATHNTVVGTNTIYYSCTTGSGNTLSTARTGSWSYTGKLAPTDPGTSHGPMQALTNANCPTTRGTAFDARNGQIYYVRKIPNSGGTGIDLCWMESNLRYAGDGNWVSSWGWADDRYATTVAGAASTASAYDDVRPLLMTPDGSPFGGSSATAPKVAGVADAGGSTDYTNTSPGEPLKPDTWGFFGYLYNWCAAMGGQLEACQEKTTQPSADITICPAGWRLPTGGPSGEFVFLANAVGATNNSDGRNNLTSNFLVVNSGEYQSRNYSVGMEGHIWASNVYSTLHAYRLRYIKTSVLSADKYYKMYGSSVRCVR